ncbi:metallophosphoesterase [candidate division KSB1 bacterium]|nr:metallophosphoesterase [candidate division KSB1 bacterium]
MSRVLRLLTSFVVFTSLVSPVTLIAQSLSEKVDFAVISDPHLYDTSLGVTGTAFQMYLAQDRKMLAESEAILVSALDSIKQMQPDFLLIPGDLTKDGEKHNHQKMAAYLTEVENAGIQVYVVPGNHDILNHHAMQFNDTTATPIDYVTPEEFSTIYAAFGYNEAIAKDPNSLSYIVEPAEGIWLFALDGCLYDGNTETETITGGNIRAATMTWLIENLKTARQLGKLPIGMLHHAVLEHYAGQKAFFPEYVISNNEALRDTLVEHGRQLVFTGHYHSQDITIFENENGKQIVDIETGSLVTYPSPYRQVTITPELAVNVETHKVTSIDYELGGIPFEAYAQQFLMDGLQLIVNFTVTAPVETGGYGLSDEQAVLAVPLITNAMIAHYMGDEAPSMETMATVGALLGSTNPMEQLVGQFIGSLWTDIAPTDNSAEIQLTDISATGIGSIDKTTTSKQFSLSQNYPNPFNPETSIGYSLTRTGHVTLAVYDLQGRNIRTLVDGVQHAGDYAARFSGNELASGLYVYQLQVNGQQVNRKMLLVK